MSKFNVIKYDAAGVPDEATLPGFGVRVLGCTKRDTPFETLAVHEAFAKLGMGKMKDGVNHTAGEYLGTGRELPSEVMKILAADGHEQLYTRSGYVEMFRVQAEDREQGMPKFFGEWAWVSDVKPLSEALDQIPTHWILAPEFE